MGNASVNHMASAMAQEQSNDHLQPLCVADCPLATGQLQEPLESCNAYLSLVVALQFYWGLTSFKPGQLEALLPIACSFQHY